VSLKIKTMGNNLFIRKLTERFSVSIGACSLNGNEFRIPFVPSYDDQRGCLRVLAPWLGNCDCHSKSFVHSDHLL